MSQTMTIMIILVMCILLSEQLLQLETYRLIIILLYVNKAIVAVVALL